MTNTENELRAEEIKDRIDEIEKRLDELNDYDLLEEEITELYGTFKIGVCEFDAGRILRELDEIAFNCSLDDLHDEEISELESEKEELEKELTELQK
jgi:hypothetical protein